LPALIADDIAELAALTAANAEIGSIILFAKHNDNYDQQGNHYRISYWQAYHQYTFTVSVLIYLGTQYAVALSLASM
jgi:hypothetical protein